jgi:hypothetical protein
MTVIEETQQEQITISKVPTSRRISVGGKNRQNGATERGIQATAINLPESQEWEPIHASRLPQQEASAPNTIRLAGVVANHTTSEANGQ